MNNNEMDMKTLADQLWNYFQPKLERYVGSCVRFYRAEVTANPGSNSLTVRRPFDTVTQTLPCVASIANAAVGSQVVVLVLGRQNGNISNSVVIGNGKLTNL